MCKAFQNIAAQPFFLLGIDVFWFAMPPVQIDLETVSDNYYTWISEEADGRPYFRIVPGPVLNECMLARYRSMAAYLDRGLNVIADEVFWSREWLEESLKVFAPYITYYAGVFCEDSELSRREIQRGDRYCGWARGSQIYAHKDARYDVSIDSTHRTPEECAWFLWQYVAENPSPTAAASMYADMIASS